MLSIAQLYHRRGLDFRLVTVETTLGFARNRRPVVQPDCAIRARCQTDEAPRPAVTRQETRKIYKIKTMTSRNVWTATYSPYFHHPPAAFVIRLYIDLYKTRGTRLSIKPAPGPLTAHPSPHRAQPRWRRSTGHRAARLSPPTAASTKPLGKALISRHAKLKKPSHDTAAPGGKPWRRRGRPNREGDMARCSMR